MGVVIGPLSATPFRLIESSVSGGSGVPAVSITSTPASRTSHVNATPVASSTRRVASVSSGPVPSPGTSVTSYGIRRVRIVTLPRGTAQVPSATSRRRGKERDDRVQAWSRGRRRLRDGDRRARPRRRRAPLPRGRHRGARRLGALRTGVGPPRRRGARARATALRGVRRSRPHGPHAVGPPDGHGAARRRVGAGAAHRHLRRRGQGGSPPPLRDDHLGLRAVCPPRRRSRRPGRPGARGRGGDHRRAVPARVARRGRPRRTSRRSTRTGSAPPSTASTPRRSRQGSSRRRAPTPPPRCRPPWARSPARSMEGRRRGYCRCSTAPPPPLPSRAS